MAHKDIDIEYMVEGIAQRRYCSKKNELSYDTLKNIAEDEAVYYSSHDDDTLREMRKRITFRYNHKIRFIQELENSIWYKWRKNPYFISNYERNLREGRWLNRCLAR